MRAIRLSIHTQRRPASRRVIERPSAPQLVGTQRERQILFTKRQDQRCRLLRSLGQTADSARIEDQHEGQPT